ncbi:MAG: protein kinase [Lachnospiraceae bacterium]|nr:protein kinase [Lachnospiraceae bacterium]
MPDSRYEYIKKVGGGATCETFLIRHKDMDEYRLLKKLPLSQQNQMFFDTEVEILKHIKGKGIPILYDLAVRDDSLLIIEEFADGKSLKCLLLENNTDILTAIRCIIGVCHILSILHRYGFVYLDIKPEHIILCQDTPYLIDYGNCMASGSSNTTMISEKFGAPEQFHGEIVGIYSDIYSIGVLLKDICTYCSDSRSIGGQLTEIIETCMAPLPEERFSDITYLIAALESCIKSRELFTGLDFIKNRIPDSVIHIYGIREHVGCTHLSLALANHLSEIYGTTDYISESRQDSFISMMDNGILKRGRNGDFFYNKVRVKNSRWNYIRQQEISQITIIDCGCIPEAQQKNTQADISGTNILIISDTAPWNDRNSLHYRLKEICNLFGENIIIAANFTDKAEGRKISNYIGKKLIRIPLFDNPLRPTREARYFLNQIVRKIDFTKAGSIHRDT